MSTNEDVCPDGGATLPPAAMCLAGPGDRLPPREVWRQQQAAADALKAEVFLLLTFKRASWYKKDWEVFLDTLFVCLKTL